MQLDIIVVLLRQAFLGHFSQTGIWQPRTLSLVKTPKAEVKQTRGEYLNWFKREPTENAGPTRRTLLPSGDERGLYANCVWRHGCGGGCGGHVGVRGTVSERDLSI